jgi:hypothetical protein
MNSTMTTTPTPLDEKAWNTLLIHIRHKRVIPVIGPELVTIAEPDGTRIPLYRWLAPRLAAWLELPDPEGYTALNDVACAYLLDGRADRSQIYDGLRNILDGQRLEPSPSLVRLAAITDFDLFITSTFDPMLALAMEKARPGFARSKDVLAYDTKPRSPFPDPVPASLVYHILGDLSSFTADFAVWEEDFMEYLCCLVAQSGDEGMKGLFGQLKERHLLMLGAPFNDWVVRFFLRAARGQRLTERRSRNTTETIADHRVNLGEPTVFFFDRLVQATRVVEGDPSSFVDELSRRWQNQRSGSAQDFLDRLSQEMPRGAVFISYSRDDQVAATRLAMTLDAANIPVWLDTQRLRVGENYERSLEGAVRQQCSFFLSLISSATEADQSRYVHKERQWAAQRHQDGYAFYLPLLLDGTPEPKLEPDCFRAIHREPLPADGSPSEGFVQRLRALQEAWRTSGQPRD